jgi:hypothetical protein
LHKRGHKPRRREKLVDFNIFFSASQRLSGGFFNFTKFEIFNFKTGGHMKQLFTFLAITTLLFATSACSGKKLPDPSAIKGKNILAVLKDMRSAYEKKDLSSFLDNVAPGYPDRDAFSKSLTEVFSQNETIRFNIQYAKMLITVKEKGPITVACNWDGEWTAVGGTTQKNGGRVTLVFEQGSSKLISIEGKDPFIPQPVEMPGKQ